MTNASEKSFEEFLLDSEGEFTQILSNSPENDREIFENIADELLQDNGWMFQNEWIWSDQIPQEEREIIEAGSYNVLVGFLQLNHTIEFETYEFWEKFCQRRNKKPEPEDFIENYEFYEGREHNYLMKYHRETLEYDISTNVSWVIYRYNYDLFRSGNYDDNDDFLYDIESFQDSILDYWFKNLHTLNIERLDDNNEIYEEVLDIILLCLLHLSKKFMSDKLVRFAGKLN